MPTITPREGLDFFVRAGQQDSHTLIRSFYGIAQIASDRVPHEIDKLANVLGIGEFFDSLNTMAWDIIHVREAGAKRLVVDALCFVGTVGGVALWLQTAGAVSFVALTTLDMATKVTLVAWAAFFAIKTYDTYSYQPLTGEEVCTLANETGESWDAGYEVTGDEGNEIAQIKNASVEWAFIANASKTALCAAPLLGSAVPPMGLALLAVTSGIASLMELDAQYQMDEVVTTSINDEDVHTPLSRHIVTQLKTSTDHTVLTTVQDRPEVPSELSRLPSWFALFFNTHTKALTQNAPAVIRLTGRYFSTDVTALSKAFDGAGFFAILEFPKQIARMALLRELSWRDRFTTVSSAISNVLGCVKWYDSAFLSPILNKYVRNYAKVFSLADSLLTEVLRAVTEGLSAERMLKIARFQMSIAMILMVTEVPLLNFVPGDWEEKFVKDILSASGFAITFILHFMHQHALHLRELEERNPV